MTTGALRGAGGVGCEFCDLDRFRRADLVLEDARCLYATDTSDSEVLPGSGIIVPKRHVESPFALTADEWLSTRELVINAKREIDQRLRPDGYTIGWNVGGVGGQTLAHVHLHVLARFADEPHAGKGMRWWLKRSDNRRPDPTAPGAGRVDGSVGG